MNEKEWTIMIYMAGDNNLAVDMAYAMEQIKGVAGEDADSPNLFVYYDGNSPSIPTLYCDFSDPRQPKYVRSFKVPTKLYDVPEKQNENAADKKSMLNFINWCVNDVEVEHADGRRAKGRRAKRYALIISGHSLGFQDIGLFKDESSGKSMKMSDLYFLLLQAVATQEELNKDAEYRGFEGEERDRETTLLLGQKLDILGFDSCVMGMLEVGYQFSDVAKAMIASEGSVPNAGWTYAKILGCLAKGSMGVSRAEDVTEHFVRQFIESQDKFTVGGVSVDMAAWDLSRFEELTKAVNELAVVLLDCFVDPQSRIYRQMERAILQVHWKCQSYMFDQNVDLGDFCEMLDQECGFLIDELGGGEDTVILKDVRQACRKVMGELEKAVILSGFSGGEYQYSNGVSVFFPWSRDGYEVSKKNYEGLWFVKDTGRSRKFTWSGFLRKYLYEVALRPAAPHTPDALPGTRYRYESGIRFHEPLDEETMPGITNGETRIAGHAGSKIAGQAGSKIAGHAGSKIAGHAGSKIAGHAGSKLAGGGSDRFFENLKLFKNIESRWDVSGFTKRAKDYKPESEKSDINHSATGD